MKMKSENRLHKDCYIVNVLLSAYNGAVYIQEQLNSLYRQDKVQINLFVRDDGSKDNTIELVQQYSDKFNSLYIYRGKNIGATKSYYRLAKKVLSENVPCDYYAFCDQDDIWKDDKLINGIKELIKLNGTKPLLYYSNLIIADQKGNEKGLLIDKDSISISKYNGLASIATYGCTCIFNELALEKFCCIRNSSEYIYHDNWMYAVCTFMGNTYYDDNSYILYRQTGKNVSGEKKRGIGLWIQRAKKMANLSEERNIYENIASELLFCFRSEMNSEDMSYLQHFLRYRTNIKSMLWLVFTRRMKVKSLSKNICIMGRTILKKL